jgi:hypothetical protein
VGILQSPFSALRARLGAAGGCHRLPQERIYLTRRQAIGEDVDELGEQRNIRPRQELFDVRCQLKEFATA